MLVHEPFAVKCIEEPDAAHRPYFGHPCISWLAALSWCYVCLGLPCCYMKYQL